MTSVSEKIDEVTLAMIQGLSMWARTWPGFLDRGGGLHMVGLD